MSDLTDMFEVVRGCCLHDPQWTPDDVRGEPVAWIGDRRNGPESSSLIIVQLKDGHWGLFTQSEDYTGHGCQCGSMTAREADLRTLLTHLDDHELRQVISR